MKKKKSVIHLSKIERNIYPNHHRHRSFGFRGSNILSKKEPSNRQKQPPEMFNKNVRKIHRKIPVSESFFNKVAGLKPAEFSKNRL